MVKVSIAMATYNGAKYLREQLDSLYSQTIIPDEIVVCDDCSTDETCLILEEYHVKKGLKFVVNKKNLGVNRNFEKAIRLCSNSYVAICDQDDIWFPHKIEVMLNKMIEIESGLPCVVSSKSTSLVNSKIHQYCNRGEDSVGIEATLLRPNNVQGCTLMLNKKMIELLKPFPESYKDVMMYDCYISFVAASCGLKYNIDQVLMAYRQHESNVFGKIQEKRPFVNRIASRIKYLKMNRIFPFSRSFTLKYIYDEYSDVMHNDAKTLIKEMIAYKDKGLLGRLDFIVSMNNFTLWFKIKNVLYEIVLFFIPIK